MGLFKRLYVLLAVSIAVQGCSAKGGGSADHSPSAPTLSSIEIGPGLSQIASGTIQRFSAIGLYSDGKKADVTSSVNWASLDSEIATIGNSSADAGFAKALIPGATQVKASLDGISSTVDLIVSSATLSKLTLTASSANVAVGTDQQIVATALFSDGTWQDVTESATWGSSDGAVAVVQDDVGSKGRVKGVSAGQVSIFASFASTPASIGLNVAAGTLQKITLVSNASSLAKGSVASVRAIATFSDASIKDVTEFAAWDSSNTAVLSTASIPPARQIMTGVGAGSAQLTATYLGISGTLPVPVTASTLEKLQIEPSGDTIAKGLSIGLKSVGIFSDGSKQDMTLASVWTSGSPGVVIVENSLRNAGVARGISLGSSTISAKAMGKSSSVIITVSSATLDQLSLWPIAPVLAPGSTIPFVATALLSDNTVQDATANSFWGIDDSTIGQLGILSPQGQPLSGRVGGGAALSAAFQGKSTNTPVTVTTATPTTLSITPANLNVVVGTSIRLRASVVFSDGSTQDATPYVAWGISPASLASVSNAEASKGLVRGLANGTASITAQYLGLTATSALVVSGASVSSIAISPMNPVVAKNSSMRLTAIATLSDGTLQDITTDAVWGAATESVASMGNLDASSGLLSAKKKGNATITAKYGNVTGSTSLKVTDATLQALSISPSTVTIAKNAAQTFTSTAKFSDGSSLDVTNLTAWKSSDIAVAVVSNAEESRGFAQGLSAGTTTINAHYKQSSASVMLTVLPASIASVEVLPANPSVNVGSVQQFTATIHYSDGTSSDATELVSWGSVNSSVATISNIVGTAGLAQSNVIGSTTITAIYAGHAGSTPMTVH